MFSKELCFSVAFFLSERNKYKFLTKSDQDLQEIMSPKYSTSTHCI